MKLKSLDTRRPLEKTELLAVLGLEGEALALPTRVQVPTVAAADFKGEFRQTRATDAGAGPAKRVVLIGLGKEGELSLERLRRAAGLAVRAANSAKVSGAVLWLPAAVQERLGAERAGRALGEAVRMASFSCTRFKSKADAPPLKTFALAGSGAPFRRGVARGDVVGQANGFTRDLQEAPGNRMRPRDLVAAARKVAARSPRIKLQALGEARMRALGMGSLLSVSRGSAEPPFLIHLVYRPKGRSKGRLALIGKGVTFDAGGISLKPSAKMEEMKYDMSGGAAVLGVFHALAALGAPCEIHGLIPATENLPDGRANKPGDIVEAMNGKTIEVLNTDAEGRLILADALAYAVAKVKPDTIIDLATLTGAVVVALGHELTGMFATTDELARRLQAAGEETGELVWRLPLLDVHKEQMKGRVADLRNVNSGQGAGSSAGAAFLASFAGAGEWAHLDIAGTAWGAEERDYVGGSTGTGVGVRLLLRYLESL